MDRRSSPRFNYSRSELFNVAFTNNNRRAFLTAPDRYETVVGVRLVPAEEVIQYWMNGFGFLGVNGNVAQKGVALTLCDANKVPLIETVPGLRFSTSWIRQQSVAAGATLNGGPSIPLKIEPTRISLAASFVTALSPSLETSLWELFYR